MKEVRKSGQLVIAEQVRLVMGKMTDAEAREFKGRINADYWGRTNNGKTFFAWN